MGVVRYQQNQRIVHGLDVSYERQREVATGGAGKIVGGTALRGNFVPDLLSRSEC